MRLHVHHWTRSDQKPMEIPHLSCACFHHGVIRWRLSIWKRYKNKKWNLVSSTPVVQSCCDSVEIFIVFSVSFDLSDFTRNMFFPDQMTPTTTSLLLHSDEGKCPLRNDHRLSGRKICRENSVSDDMKLLVGWHIFCIYSRFFMSVTSLQ